MSVFSEKLSAFMKEKEMTSYALAKYCSMDCSNVYKIVEGTRHLHSEAKVKKIANILSLSPYEFEELMRAWKITEVGEHIYFERKLIREFIGHLKVDRDLSLIKKSAKDPASGNDIAANRTLRGKSNLYAYIKYMVEKELLNSQPHVSLICQPEDVFLYNLLAMYGNEMDNFTIKHLICLESLTAAKENQYNLKGLNVLAPLLMSSCSYQVYYYYDKVQSHFYNLNILPCLFLTQQDVLLMSSDLEYGICIHDKSQIEVLRQLFESYITNGNTQELFKNVQDVRQLLSSYSGVSDDSLVGVLSSGPMSASVPIEITLKYFRPEKKKEMESLWKETKDYVAQCIEKDVYRNFFTEDGIRDFMENSHIVDLLSDDISEFSLQDRLTVIERMLYLLENEYIAGYMLQPGVMNMPRDFYMTVYEKGSVNILFKNACGRWRLLDVNEKSLGVSFYNFMEYLSESDCVYNLQETRDRVKALLNEYKEKFKQI